MRILSLVFLLLVAAVVGLFVYQNQNDVTVRFWDREITASMPLLAAVIFLVGMLGGWTLLGAMRRSVGRVVEHRR